MSNPKVTYPRCFPDDLYKFGFDPHGNQKYLYKDCKHQFAPETLKFTSNKTRSKVDPGNHKYPSCLRCGKASFLHRDYKYYSNFSCCDKECNHYFFVPKNEAIKPPSYILSLPGKIAQVIGCKYL